MGQPKIPSPLRKIILKILFVNLFYCIGWNESHSCVLLLNFKSSNSTISLNFCSIENLSEKESSLRIRNWWIVKKFSNFFYLTVYLFLDEHFILSYIVVTKGSWTLPNKKMQFHEKNVINLQFFVSSTIGFELARVICSESVGYILCMNDFIFLWKDSMSCIKKLSRINIHEEIVPDYSIDDYDIHTNWLNFYW